MVEVEQEGRDAYRARIAHTANPYAKDDVRGLHWQMGWIKEAHGYAKVVAKLITREVAA